MKKYILFLFFVSSLYSSGQTTNQNPYILPKDNPYLVPPSPEVSSFMRFGQYPVSYSTGIPNISIPIYTIKTKELTFPIDLSYHAGGIKVDDQASWAGLGWTLNAGGAVNRSIQGMPDEQYSKILSSDYLFNNDRYDLLLKMITSPSGQAFIDDLMKDRYDYSFSGQSGSFFIGSIQNQGYNYDIMQFPSTDNKIYGLQTNVLPDKGFQIITPDGTSYYFTAYEKTVVTSINRNQSSSQSTGVAKPYTYTSAWYLNKIVSFNRTDSIELIYESHINNYMDYSLSQDITGVYDSANHGLGTFSYSSLITTRTQLITQILKEIRFNEGKVAFGHVKDRLDSRLYRLTQIDIYNSSGILKSVKFDHSYFAGTRLKLNSVSFFGNDNKIYDKYSFNYHEEYRMPGYFDYSKGAMYIGEYNDYYSQDESGYFNGKTNKSLIPIFPDNAPVNFTSSKADRSFSFPHARANTLRKISYISGGETEFVYDSYPGTQRRSPALRIKEIISRKKAGDDESKEHTIYRYSDAIYDIPFSLDEQYKTQNRTLEPKPEIVILVKNYTTCSSESKILNLAQSMKYKYGKVEELIVGGNRIDTLKTVYEYLNEKTNTQRTQQFIRINAFYNPTNWGKLYSHYQYVGINIRPSFTLIDILSPEFLNQKTSPGYIIDIGWKDSFLKSKTQYRYNQMKYEPVISITNDYQYFNVNDKLQIGLSVAGLLPNYDGPVLDHANQQLLFNNSTAYIDCKSANNFYFYDIYVSTGWRKLISTTTREFNEGGVITKTETFGYEAIQSPVFPHSFLTKHTENVGQSVRKEYFYKYPRDYSTLDFYKKMVEGNCIMPSVFNYTFTWQDQAVRPSVTEEKTDYKYFPVNGKNIILPGTFTNSVSKVNSDGTTEKGEYKTDILLYDAKGNPVFLVNQADFSTVYIWENNNLIAEVKNATSEEVKTAIGNNSYSNALLSKGLSDSEIKTLRSNLSKAQITTYTYKSLVGLTSITDPSGLTTYYDYDSFGRLKETYLIENGVKKVLQSYDYHYKNQ